MVILRLHNQVTCHKQPIVAVATRGNLLATAEQGVIKLWTLRAAEAETAGPTLLRAIACSRQPFRALFITPGCSYVAGIFAEAGIVLFDVASGLVEKHVLDTSTEGNGGGKILAAAWNGDTCSLALATEAGGVKIYSLLPAHHTHNIITATSERSLLGVVVRPPPATLVLQHEIIIKGLSPVEQHTASAGNDKELSFDGNGNRKFSISRVTSLATNEMPPGEERGGAAILLGMVEGHHLCVWDLTTGCTLLTALALAPDGCKVEKMAWHAPAGLVALVQSLEEGARRIDVYQLDIVGKSVNQVLSYTSDVLIAGVSFSAAPNPGASAVYASGASGSFNNMEPRLPTYVYLHVVDRLRTLRTWLLHLGGAIAVSAYSLPTPAPRVPIPMDVVARVSASASGPESHDTISETPRDDKGDCNAHDGNVTTAKVRGSGEKHVRSSGERVPQQRHRRHQPEQNVVLHDEEAVDPRTLATGAVVATVIPGPLPQQDGPCFLVMAGVALSIVSFLKTSDVCTVGQHGDQGTLLEIEQALDARDRDGLRDGAPRVFGMQAIVSEPGGLQAVAVLWAERPSFQVLDVGGAGEAATVQNVSLARLHRENQVTAVPRRDRVCFLTSWAHSTVLKTLLCGWNDGVVDIVSPRNPARRVRLLRPGSICIPVTALCAIPISILTDLGNQILSYLGGGDSETSGGIAKLAFAGSADGTIALWSTAGASRPLHVLLAHSDAVVSVRTTMDAPSDAYGCRQATATRYVAEHTRCNRGTGVFGRAEHCAEESRQFFVVTAGANREVKVWGIRAGSSIDADAVRLTLGGYTVVGTGRANDRLTVVELLSERFIVCGFASGAVEVWAIPFDSRGAASLATVRAAEQAFPKVHGATVTSITVSLGLKDPGSGGLDGSVGRTVFTTSTDCTAVRWVSLAPGDSLKPLCRYCLSSEPAAMVLLPPSNVTPSNRIRTAGVPQGAPGTTTATTFRVVAALEGTIIVLELATTRQLLRGNSVMMNTTQDPRSAIANAIPGTPLVPQIAFRFPSEDGSGEMGGPGIRWAVGGVLGRKAGSYEVLGGIQGVLKEWEATGNRRIIASMSARTAWEVDNAERVNGTNERRGEGHGGSIPTGLRQQQETNESSAKLPRWTQKRSEKRDNGKKVKEAINALARPSNTLKTTVTTLSIHTDEDIDYGVGGDSGTNSKEGYRRVRGGKLIKLDPEFVANCDDSRKNHRPVGPDDKDSSFKTTPGEPMNDDMVLRSSSKHIVSESVQNTMAYSLELTMPTYSLGSTPENLSSVGPRSVGDRSTTIDISKDLCVDTSRAESPGTPLEWGNIHCGGSTVLGWPPSLPPPTHTDTMRKQNPMLLGMLQSVGSISPSTDISQGETMKSTGEMSPSVQELLNEEHEDEDTLLVGSRKSATNACEKPPGAAKVTVANAAIARAKREVDGSRSRSPTVLSERRPPILPAQVPRPPFNFDSAQAPLAGMSGVGVAVPRGFSDTRMHASKRSFTSVAPMNSVTRQRIGGRMVQTSSTLEVDRRRREIRKIEIFPTGLVMSKHFREASTGREILMLEIEKAAFRLFSSPSNVNGSASEGHSLDFAGARAEIAANAELAAAAAAAAAAAEAAEMALLSPRTQLLRQVFTSLSSGRELLTQEALVKWKYVSGAIDRGLVSEYQVKSLYRKAHGGRQRGRMVWRDIVSFYNDMEDALDKACTPPLIEEFVVDSEDWNSVSASLHLTKRGDVYVVAVETVDADAQSSPLPAPAPAAVRDGVGGGIAAWTTATATNPHVPIRVTLTGLSPERSYVLYAYAENGGGRVGGGDGNDYGVELQGGFIKMDTTRLFSVEPAPSGMSGALVKATRLVATTTREPDEELDVPWEDLSEEEKMAEALAALSDPGVARAARQAGLDVPSSEDLARREKEMVSKNKWRSFCRWWADRGASTAERSAFLLRECVFAAQQSEVVEEAARMGVQLLDDDWTVAVDGDADGEGTRTTSSGRHQRWTAFRSWYRGGRVFDRAHEALIAAAIMQPLPSPASEGRPLTPCLVPTDCTPPVAPSMDNTCSSDLTVPPESELAPGVRPLGEAEGARMIEGGAKGIEPSKVTMTEVPTRAGLPSRQVATAEPIVHVVTLPVSLVGEEAHATSDKARDIGTLDTTSLSDQLGPLLEEDLRSVEESVDGSSVDGLVGWNNDRIEEASIGEMAARGEGEKVPRLVATSGSQAAKQLRMEARRKFLAARTVDSKAAAKKVEKLLDLKREDVKAKRVVAAASGVVVRSRKAAKAARGLRRRSHVERELALKRANEILERSGKAEDIRQRRGSLGTLRPEDVAAIGVFDDFNLSEFDPEKPDPDLFRRRSSALGESSNRAVSDSACATAIWKPYSFDERTLELQLACVHPKVCLLAALVGVGVPDPEDVSTLLSHKKTRWEAFSRWYFPPDVEMTIAPHRQVLLDGEMEAATTDEAIRDGLIGEGLEPDDCEETDFLAWYCDEGAVPRREFRRRRVNEMLQARRLLAMQALAYMPMPFVFTELPVPFPPPHPREIDRFQFFPSSSLERFSLTDVLRWYGKDELDKEDAVLRSDENAGQRAALLEAARAEAADMQALERRVMQWEDLRSELLRSAESELQHDPFRVGEGLENKDEVLDALEVARKEAQEERERVAEVRRQRGLARFKRSEDERRLREEAERLRWMLETKERRNLVQQHMSNLKRQRALEAERLEMEREEKATLSVIREENRLLEERRAKEAIEAEVLRVRDVKAVAAARLAAELQRERDSEILTMSVEDELSRQLTVTRRAAELLLQQKGAFLRELYTPFVPMDATVVGVTTGEGKEQERHALRGWKDTDVPLIWGGPTGLFSGRSKATPGSRFVPYARAILDELETQPTSIGRLSREFLNLLGLPYACVRDMYKQGSWTVKDGDAMVDDIQLGRVFTMFEKDEVRNNLVPVIPLERLGTRRLSRGTTRPPERQRNNHGRPQTTIEPGQSSHHRRHQGRYSSSLSQPRDKNNVLLFPISEGHERKLSMPSASARRGGTCTAERLIGGCGGRVDWPGRGWGPRQVVRTGAEAIVGLPLSGDERGDEAVISPVTAAALAAHARVPPVMYHGNDLGLTGAMNAKPDDTTTSSISLSLDSEQQQKLKTSQIAAQSSLKIESDVHQQQSRSFDVPASPNEQIFTPSPKPSDKASATTVEAQPKRRVLQAATVDKMQVVRRQDGNLQWGGFGPGHVPRYFRGKFGVAGKKKNIVGRKTQVIDSGE